jgi:hypothetical protein
LYHLCTRRQFPTCTFPSSSGTNSLRHKSRPKNTSVPSSSNRLERNLPSSHKSYFPNSTTPPRISCSRSARKNLLRSRRQESVSVPAAQPCYCTFQIPPDIPCRNTNSDPAGRSWARSGLPRNSIGRSSRLHRRQGKSRRPGQRRRHRFRERQWGRWWV